MNTSDLAVKVLGLLADDPALGVGLQGCTAAKAEPEDHAMWQVDILDGDGALVAGISHYSAAPGQHYSFSAWVLEPTGGISYEDPPDWAEREIYDGPSLADAILALATEPIRASVLALMESAQLAEAEALVDPIPPHLL